VLERAVMCVQQPPDGVIANCINTPGQKQQVRQLENNSWFFIISQTHKIAFA